MLGQNWNYVKGCAWIGICTMIWWRKTFALCPLTFDYARGSSPYPHAIEYSYTRGVCMGLLLFSNPYCPKSWLGSLAHQLEYTGYYIYIIWIWTINHIPYRQYLYKNSKELRQLGAWWREKSESSGAP